VIELTRFQQLRPAQKISDEEKQQIGLPLYPDAGLSPLANHLRDSATSVRYAEVLNQYKEGNAKYELNDPKTIQPVIRSLYDWFSFKARPIKLDDFRSFVGSLNVTEFPKLEEEWRLYADNLVVAIERNVLHTNYCIDFQLLIRVCYIIRLCLTTKQDGKYEVDAGVTSELINQILNLPIVLPQRILRSRCPVHCNEQSKLEILAPP
jgi:hypothetical protein